MLSSMYGVTFSHKVKFSITAWKTKHQKRAGDIDIGLESFSQHVFRSTQPLELAMGEITRK